MSTYEMFSILDVFFLVIVKSWYNIIINLKSLLEPNGFHIEKSDGLINAKATFQRVMNISFCGLIIKYIVVYLDDVTVFS